MVLRLGLNQGCSCMVLRLGLNQGCGCMVLRLGLDQGCGCMGLRLGVNQVYGWDWDVVTTALVLPSLHVFLYPSPSQRFYKKAAAFVLRAVAKHSPELAQSVVDCGALDALVICLEEFDPGVKESAAWALGYIARHNAGMLISGFCFSGFNLWTLNQLPSTGCLFVIIDILLLRSPTCTYMYALH